MDRFNTKNMTDDRAILDGKHFVFGLTRFTQPMHKDTHEATLYLIDKSRGLYFNVTIEFTGVEVRAAGFLEVLHLLDYRIQKALSQLLAEVNKYDDEQRKSQP
jgi:hypothetical protein